jgi:hypothetical protein
MLNWFKRKKKTVVSAKPAPGGSVVKVSDSYPSHSYIIPIDDSTPKKSVTSDYHSISDSYSSDSSSSSSDSSSSCDCAGSSGGCD